MLIVNILLVVMIYPMIGLMYYFGVRETGVKGKPTVVGVTLPEAYRQEPEVKEIVAGYKRSLRWWMLLAALLPALFVWMPWLSFFIAGYMLWVFGAIAMVAIPFARAHRQLRSLKLVKGWFPKGEEGAVLSEGSVYVDLAAAASPTRMVRPWLLILLCALSALPVLYEWFAGPVPELRHENSIIPFSFACVTFVLAPLIVWMDREKAEILSRNSAVNTNFERSKKRQRGMAYIGILILNTVTVWLMELFIHHLLGGMTGFAVWMVIYTVVICAVALRCEFRVIKLRAKLRCDENGTPYYVDDDEHWLLGVIYCNPHDKHFIVEKRSLGYGTTINVGSRAGKIFTVIFAVLILFCVIALPIWIGLEEFTPISAGITDDGLKVSQVLTDYEISFSEMEDVELLSFLPEMSRKNGTGLPELLKGKFEVDGEGRADVCLNPKNQLFLRITDKDGGLYFFSGNTDEETRALYAAVTERVE